jgi:hypothetical protein
MIGNNIHTDIFSDWKIANKVIGLILFTLSGVVNADQTCLTGNIPATTPHLVGNSNGTATDPKTGLVWKRCSEGQSWNEGSSSCTGTIAKYKWQEALVRAKDVRESQANTENFGYHDWRLPNIKELQTIMERQCYAPAINLTIFPNTPSAGHNTAPWYWSSTPVFDSTDLAWALNSHDGDAWLPSGFSDRNEPNYVRLVRGGF